MILWWARTVQDHAHSCPPQPTLRPATLPKNHFVPTAVGHKGLLRAHRARLYIGGHVGTVPVTNPGNSRVESTRERVEHMAEPTPRKRGRRSARQAGSRFERQIADYLRDHIDDRIDRRVTNG